MRWLAQAGDTSGHQVTDREARSAYGAALLLVVASVILTVAAHQRSWGGLIAALLQGAALIATLRVSGFGKGITVGSMVLAVLAVSTVAALMGRDTRAAQVIGPAIACLLVLATIGAIFRRVATFETVTLQLIFGLLTVYVLLGLFFAYAFMLAAGLTGRPFFADGGTGASTYVYFSYVTIATVGYGDLVAVPGLPRALAIAEAIIGQLYLVSVVALAVGRLGNRRQVGS